MGPINHQHAGIIAAMRVDFLPKINPKGSRPPEPPFHPRIHRHERHTFAVGCLIVFCLYGAKRRERQATLLDQIDEVPTHFVSAGHLCRHGKNALLLSSKNRACFRETLGRIQESIQNTLYRKRHQEKQIQLKLACTCERNHVVCCSYYNSCVQLHSAVDAWLEPFCILQTKAFMKSQVIFCCKLPAVQLMRSPHNGTP